MYSAVRVIGRGRIICYNNFERECKLNPRLKIGPTLSKRSKKREQQEGQKQQQKHSNVDVSKTVVNKREGTKVTVSSFVYPTRAY